MKKTTDLEVPSTNGYIYITQFIDLMVREYDRRGDR